MRRFAHRDAIVSPLHFDITIRLNAGNGEEDERKKLKRKELAVLGEKGKREIRRGLRRSDNQVLLCSGGPDDSL